jgi:uncharacterized membrane protein
VPIALLKTQAIVFPLAYVPQALVSHAGLHFGQSFLALLYEARLLNLLFCLGITLAAMRIMPFGKEVLAAVSLLPMAVFERSQISTDGLVMASAALVVAVTLRLYDQQKQEPMKGRYGLYVLACAGLLGLAVCKSTYLSIFMLWALLLKRNKKMALVGGALIFPALLLSSWWGHFLSLHDYRILDAGRAGILDPTGKIELLIHAPVDIALRVLRTMARYSYWLGQIIGLFGQTDVPLAWPFRSLGIVWLAGVAWVSAPPNRHFEKWESCLLIGSFWIQAVLIILTIFLIWADPAAPIIEGVQGRYFLPILPGLLVGLSEIVPKWKRHITREQMRAFTFLPACFLLGCAALTIALREWAL